jgi:hypothetical protein
MKWRVMVELSGANGAIELQEVSVGAATLAGCSAETLGLTAAEGKKTLAGLQSHLVQAQTEEHCRNRRRCQHCGAQRPLQGHPPSAIDVIVWVGSWRFMRPASVPADAAWRRAGPLLRLRRSCPTAARRNMSALSPRWAPCCHTAAPARCSENSSHSGTLRTSRRSASGPFMSAPDSREKRWHRRRQHHRPRQSRSHWPLTEAT